MKIPSFILFLFLGLMACQSPPETPDQIYELWYQQAAQNWTEALPIGNGRLGAMVYSGIEEEHIQFNEETLWTGEPHDYAHVGAHKYLEEIRQLLRDGKQVEAHELGMREFMSVPLRQKAYQPFGDLYLRFDGHENAMDYRRQLNLQEAIVKTTYRVGETQFEREVFVSQPDQVLVLRLQSNKKTALSFTLWMDSPHEQKQIDTKEGRQSLKVAVKDGKLHGQATLRIETDGKIEQNDNRLIISGASEAEIFLSAATNFKNYKDISQEPEKVLEGIWEKLGQKSFAEIKKDHLQDHQNLFNRFSLDLDQTDRDSLPTDQRLEAFWENPNDPELLALYVQYARYLLITSSRPGTQPANLQGIWNDQLKPPWDSKYTVNINAEMNYWPAELTNLSECHEPLFRMVEECTESGENTAREHYNANGWVLHHNTDIWRGTAPINNSNHGIYVTGGAWLAHHFWEHYLYTLDETFLREQAYPVMKGAATFFTEFLIQDPKTGWLISSPSNSPENGGLVAGPSMDHQIIRSLFKACIQSAEILGTDTEFANKLQEMLAKIAPDQIGKHGQLQEWLEDKDDPENKHRHVSHLWGVHPGKEINWSDNPELMEAAKKSLLFRGDEGTGWSLAWKINFWARFLDGEHAYQLIKLLFRPVNDTKTQYRRGGSYPNLFDSHPPFQIDGNFGGAAGMLELLMQSHLDRIDLLPALPAALPNGQIKGLCARGGFELSFTWKEGQLQELKVLSKAGKTCNLKYGEYEKSFDTEKGKEYLLDASLNIK